MAKEVTPEQIEMLDGMVAKARAAAEIIATYDQERVDRLCQAVAASVIDMKVWANLADEAVDETGLGDKVTKRNKRNKLKLILRDIGVPSYDPLQIIEKTQGRMAEDHQWLRILYRDEVLRHGIHRLKQNSQD